MNLNPSIVTMWLAIFGALAYIGRALWNLSGRLAKMDLKLDKMIDDYKGHLEGHAEAGPSGRTYRRYDFRTESK